MRHYLGIDIGTFESKGVLVDGAGRIVASTSRPHRMRSFPTRQIVTLTNTATAPFARSICVPVTSCDDSLLG